MQQPASRLNTTLTKLGQTGASIGVPFAASLSIIGNKLDQTDKKSKGLAATISKVGGGELLVAGVAVGALARSATSAGSDLNESLSKVNVVFGEGATIVDNWAKHAATALGLSRQQALEAAGTFGNFLISMGETQDQAQRMSVGLVQLASDLASFNNTDPAEALQALRSGLSGEVEPLRRYGVSLSAARVQQAAATAGIKANYNELSAAQKATLAYQIILQDTSLAQGDFARTASGLANQTRINTARFADFQAKLGGVLVPLLLTAEHAAFAVAGGLTAANDATGGFLGKAVALGAAVPVGVFALEKLNKAGGAIAGQFGKASQAIGLSTVATEAATVADVEQAAATVPLITAQQAEAAAALESVAADQALAAIQFELAQSAAVDAAALTELAAASEAAAAAQANLAVAEEASIVAAGGVATKAAAGVTALGLEAAAIGVLGIAFGNAKLQENSRDMSGLAQGAIVGARALSGLIPGLSVVTAGLGFLGLGHKKNADETKKDTVASLQNALAKAQEKLSNDALAGRLGKLAGDKAHVESINKRLQVAEAAVAGAMDAGASSTHKAAAAAERGQFAYLGFADSVNTAAGALAAIAAKSFGPTRSLIAADTSRTNVQSALDALNNPDTGSSGGAGGQTATAAALEQAQKVLTLRDAKRGETQATQAVRDAEEALTQSRKDATTAAKAVTVAQENLRTTLKGVSRDSQAAKDAINALASAQNAAEGSRIDVSAAGRAVTQAKLDAQSRKLAVTDAQTTLSNDIADEADPEQILKDTIALKAARLDAAGSSDAVKQAELSLSNAKLDAEQKTKDLSEAQRVENGTLRGFPNASNEAKTARQQLTDAQVQARSATDAVRQATDQLTTAINGTADASLALRRAQADLDGKLEASSGAAAAGKKLDSLQTRINNVRTAVLQLADDAGKADLATGHSFGHSILTMIQVLEQEAAASPLLAHAFDQSLKDLENQFAAQLIKSQQPSGLGGGIKIKGTGIVRRASGGPLSANQPAFVGESGIELWVPDVPGSIVSNNSLKNSRPMGGAFGQTIIINASTLEAHRIGATIVKALEEHNGGYLPRTIRTTS